MCYIDIPCVTVHLASESNQRYLCQIYLHILSEFERVRPQRDIHHLEVRKCIKLNNSAGESREREQERAGEGSRGLLRPASSSQLVLN